MYASGLGVVKICDILCEKKILSPSVYIFQTTGKRIGNPDLERPYHWAQTTVRKMLENQEYYLKENAKEYVKEFFAKRLQDPKAEHANARDVRNFLEQAVSNQACRVVELPNATVDDLRALTLADVKMCDIQ